MNDKLRGDLEFFLKVKLEPEYGYILLCGKVDEPHSTTVISCYDGNTIQRMLQQISTIAHEMPPDVEVSNN